MITATHLLRRLVLDGRYETADLIAHRLGCDTGGSGLEVDVASATSTSTEGVAAGNVEQVVRHGAGAGGARTSQSLLESMRRSDVLQLMNMDWGGGCGRN